MEHWGQFMHYRIHFAVREEVSSRAFAVAI